MKTMLITTLLAGGMLASGLFADEKGRGGGSGAPAKVKFKAKGAPKLKPFKVGVPLWASTKRYVWKEVPAGFKGASFTQFKSHHQGVTEFEVEKSGVVYMAVTTRWGKGGSRSGGWTKELTTQEQFLKQGWTPVVMLHETADDVGHEHHWVIFEREFNAGEKYRIRTEKYCAPILFFTGTP